MFPSRVSSCVDYEQSLLLLSPPSETRKTRKWPQSAFAARRSGASARPSLKLKKKRDCLQSFALCVLRFSSENKLLWFILAMKKHCWSTCGNKLKNPERARESHLDRSVANQNRAGFASFLPLVEWSFARFLILCWWQLSETTLFSALCMRSFIICLF